MGIVRENINIRSSPDIVPSYHQDRYVTNFENEMKEKGNARADAVLWLPHRAYDTQYLPLQKFNR
jgi:hypothetical protein